MRRFARMPNFRLQIPNAHFHKHWHDSAAHKGRIVTWHNQAARKHRRRENRLAKAIKNFPRPVNGLLRPVVHCQTIRYNMKKRAGKGFTLEELKEAKVNRKEARTIGISVAFRRKNRSEQSLRENVARLSEYKANLIVFPKKCNRKKLLKGWRVVRQPLPSPSFPREPGIPGSPGNNCKSLDLQL